MIQFLKNISSTLSLLSPVFKAATGIYTRHSTPAARLYAEQAVESVITQMPSAIQMAECASRLIVTGTMGLNAGTLVNVAEALVNPESSLREVIRTPSRMMHCYNNFRALSGETEVELDENEMDDFVLLSPRAGA